MSEVDYWVCDCGAYHCGKCGAIVEEFDEECPDCLAKLWE